MLPPKRSLRIAQRPDPTTYFDIGSPLSDAPSSPPPFEPSSPTSKKRRTKPRPLAKITEEHVPMTPTREAYMVPEVFNRILQHMDKRTLATMLRLEKKATAPVAAVLYEKIPVRIMSRMSRATARRIVYCNAVRVVDRDERREWGGRRARWNDHDTDFQPFILKNVLAGIPVLRKKYPNLVSILNERPRHPDSPRYSIHLAGTEITLRLHDHLFINIAVPVADNTVRDAVFKPPVVTSEECVIDHTCTFHVEEGHGSAALTPEHCKLWTDAILAHSLPDNFTEIEITNKLRFDLTAFAAFLAARQTSMARPLRKLSATLSTEAFIDPGAFEVLAAALDPGIEYLDLGLVHIGNQNFTRIRWSDLLPLLRLLDSKLPVLKTLRLPSTAISFDGSRFGDNIPTFTGALIFPHLTTMTFSAGHESTSSSISEARLLAHVGAASCSYSGGMKDYISMIRSESPHLAWARELSQDDHHRLDIWELRHIKELSSASDPPTRRALKRSAADRDAIQLHNHDLKSMFSEVSTVVQSLLDGYTNLSALLENTSTTDEGRESVDAVYKSIDSKFEEFRQLGYKLKNSLDAVDTVKYRHEEFVRAWRGRKGAGGMMVEHET